LALKKYRPSRMDIGEDDFDESIFLLGLAEAKSELPSAGVICAGQSSSGS
jgi:hypothetical protein